jgi:hypothetical protein
MKVLKRPMFKYGGDVRKQGIMHGMNGLRNGGIATTMADALGMANGGMIRQGYNKGLLVAPGVPNFYVSNAPKKFEDMTLKEKIFRPPTNPINLPGPDRIDRSDPKVVADLDAVGGDVQKYYAEKRKQDKAAAEAFKSNFTPASISASFDTEEGPAGTVNTETEQEQFLKTEGGDKSKIETPTLSKQKTDEKRLKRIYDIMGVDDAKKDAVYDALIDLSQGQGIDTKDISGSINRAIGALSKRADKVTDLKDKAKAALASGTLQAELTKEINKEKGTPYDEKEKYFKGKLGDVKGERAAVGSPLSVFAALSKTKPGDSKSTRTEQAVTEYFDGIGGVPVYKGPLPGLELETINVGEETETEDGAYRIGTGYIVVEKGIITEKKNLFPKK